MVGTIVRYSVSRDVSIESLRYCSISAVELNFLISGDTGAVVAGMLRHAAPSTPARIRQEQRMAGWKRCIMISRYAVWGDDDINLA